MNKKGINRVFTTTQLLITPGYQFKIVKAMVTNFHQPKSTLLLLVAAAIGTKWKACYAYALENDFRFLSYGDANLLFMAES
jgi:S-adenosylmethionine:tRNA ribosyltransferase-isomerase